MFAGRLWRDFRFLVVFCFSEDLRMFDVKMDERSKYLRQLALRCLIGGQRGHIGATMSLVEIMRVLYDDVMMFWPQDPKNPQRDRLILSKGHGGIAQYVLLADKGFFDVEILDSYCRFGSLLGGHVGDKVPGVEVSTGALGHGLSIGCGIAMGLKLKKIDSRVFVVCGDGELNEGSIWEALMSAAKHKLDNLMLIVDSNMIQSAGSTDDVLPLNNLSARFISFGCAVHEVDGHNVENLKRVFKSALCNKNLPSVVVCHTVKGKGISFAENNPEWHHRPEIDSGLAQRLTEALV